MNKLKELREEKGLSQSELAEYIGVSQSMIHQVENGIRPISLPLLISACYVLRCTPNDILDFYEERVIENEQ